MVKRRRGVTSTKEKRRYGWEGVGRLRTWSGTCQRLRDRPRTMPMGKRIPQTPAWRKMWIQRIESMGALASSSVSSWLACLCACTMRSAMRMGRSRRWMSQLIDITITETRVGFSSSRGVARKD